MPEASPRGPTAGGDEVDGGGASDGFYEQADAPVEDDEASAELYLFDQFPQRHAFDAADLHRATPTQHYESATNPLSAAARNPTPAVRKPGNGRQRKRHETVCLVPHRKSLALK